MTWDQFVALIRGHMWLITGGLMALGVSADGRAAILGLITWVISASWSTKANSPGSIQTAAAKPSNQVPYVRDDTPGA